MKKYILGAFLSLGILISPAFTQAAGLTNTQVQAILSLLSSFGADSATIASVNSALTGGTTTGGTTLPSCHTFGTNLKLGDGYGATTAPNNQSAFQREIFYLQSDLIKEGFSVAASDTTDNGFRNSTAMAVKSFQTKYGISKTGTVGPKTRAKLNTLYGCSLSVQQSSSVSPSITVTYPNGGEVLPAGGYYTIRWNTSGLTDQDKVYIAIQDMSTPHFDSTTINVGETPATQGLYNWNTPSNAKAGSMYKITVYTNHQTYSDSSDNYFSIVVL